MNSVIPNKLQKVRKIENKCTIHKYRRFSLKNKTFRTDCYYCANCGHKVKIEDIFGTKSICWECKKEFSIGIHNQVYPKCEDCRKSKGISITKPAPDIDLDFLESSDVETNSNDKGIELLKELGLI